MLSARAAIPTSRVADASASDAVQNAQACAESSACYWPVQALDAFLLRMAAHGCCISVAMMLGDPHYATRQLSKGQAIQDEVLHDLVDELAAYFVCSAQQERTQMA